MKRLLIAGLAAVVIAVAGVFVWAQFIRDDAPAAFELTDPPAEEAGSAGEPSSELTGLDGTWTVADGSEAGYRVIEDLGEFLDLEAVGRTSEVSGTIEISGSMVIAGGFEVDIASISSDDGRRDNQFTGAIMNAAEFPTATFTLTEPIEFGAVPADGEPVSASASGQLTLRGTTNTVTFPVDAQLVGDRIELVGAIDVLFSDYGIDNPSNPLVKVRDEGQVEVQLFFTPS